jgi:glycine cleavage system H protein
MKIFINDYLLEIKGVDYMVIIAVFLSLSFLVFYLNRRSKNRASTNKSGGVLSTDALEMPHGLFFSRYHTWTHLDQSGTAKVGLDDLLVHITGEVKVGKVLDAGEKIRKGDFLAELVQNEKTLRIYSPIAGEVMELNPLLSKNPGLINADPYHEGWICKIKPFSWVTDVQSCFLAEDAEMWARQELARFKDFMAESVARNSPDPSFVALQDGGEMCDKPLADLPKEIWREFQDDFLSRKKFCKSGRWISPTEGRK